jgi:hypothetical protein
MTASPEQDLDVEGGPVRVGVAVEDEPVLAGGPVDVVWELRLLGAGPLFVALGGERVTGRLAGFSFTATLDGADVTFADPAAGSVDLGGPLGVQPVTADGPRIEVLVNQFLTLERMAAALPAGGEGRLELTCRWEARIAPDPPAAVAVAPRPVELTCRVAVRRDDQALRALVRRHVDAVMAADREDEDARARLAALRYPDTAALVAAAGGDPDRQAWLRAALDF